MSEKIIEFDKVVAGYSPSVTILNELTLDARKGEITLLIGPNGAGKSTVLKTLFGMLVPRSGEVRFEGKRVNGKTQRELLAEGIAFVPQGRNLFGSLSVRHNLELGGITLPRGELNGRIEEVLTRFPRIKERINNQASTMSGGEQKQLEVGRALLLRPRVLLIDEPSIGLSPKLVQEVMTLLRKLADNGTTVLMVEQNVRTALKYSNRALVLEMGRLALDRPASELLHDPDLNRLFLGGIAVAGAGLIGRRHIELIAASPSCALAAIVDPAPGAVMSCAQCGCAVVRDDRRTVRTGASGRRDHRHAESAPRRQRARLHRGRRRGAGREARRTNGRGRLALVRGGGARDAKVLVGHHRAHSPILAKARAIVQQGTLGSLVAAMGSAMFYKPDHYFDEGPWRRQPGGGPILINMIHEIGNLRSLCGEIVAVQAFASNATRGFPVEDTVAINLRFANGALGTFLLSDTAASARSWEQTSQENKSYATYPDEDCYLIVGTSGSLAIPTMRLKVYDRKEDRSWWKPFRTSVAEVDRTDPLEHQLEHFCAVIRGEAQPLVTARDGLQNLRVTEAIALAARTGQPVPIEVRQ